jgi:hypothetical protein
MSMRIYGGTVKSKINDEALVQVSLALQKAGLAAVLSVTGQETGPTTDIWWAVKDLNFRPMD